MLITLIIAVIVAFVWCRFGSGGVIRKLSPEQQLGGFRLTALFWIAFLITLTDKAAQTIADTHWLVLKLVGAAISICAFIVGAKFCRIKE